MTDPLLKRHLGYNENSIKLIQKIPFLKDLDKEYLKVILDHAEFVKYTAGEFIIREYEYDLRMFFLLGGSVTIIKDDKEISMFDKVGDVFGEMAILESLPRSASVIARTDCTVISIDGSIFERFDAKRMWNVSKHFFKVFSQKLSEKLRMTDEENKRLKKRIEIFEKGETIK